MEKILNKENSYNEKPKTCCIFRFPFSIFRFPFSILLMFFALSSVSFAQNPCLTKAEADKIIQTITNPPKAKKNKKIRRELVKMQEEQTELNEKIHTESGEDKILVEKLNVLSREHFIRLCGIYKEYGWLTEKSIETEGLEAALFIIRNSKDAELQREIFPVIAAATQKGFISKANLASLIDRIRIKSGEKQIFGTQIKIEDEVGFMYPLENEARVDDWRKIYELPSLNTFIKQIESEYRTIIVKMAEPPTLKDKTRNALKTDELNLGLSGDDEDEILSVESRLVNLNVRVLDENLNNTRGLNLKKDDFQIFENGEQQEITFFSTADTPFDLVLLLDLSGSTLQKQSLIVASARRFIELARPNDRIAIISFTDRAKIISEFTGDKRELFAKLDQIEDYGGSKIWDALEFTYKKVLAKQEKGRRSAVVFMTDGVDNTLMQTRLRINGVNTFSSLPPSKITFTELLETVRKNDANVFSIYLDTEYLNTNLRINDKSYRQARRTLKLISEESGGQYYRAGQIEELSGIYEKIINDLSEVYSLGYEPKNAENDGSWRELKIKIKEKSNLTVKSKRGYYAN